jgi:hypothetical protein
MLYSCRNLKDDSDRGSNTSMIPLRVGGVENGDSTCIAPSFAILYNHELSMYRQYSVAIMWMDAYNLV